MFCSILFYSVLKYCTRMWCELRRSERSWWKDYQDYYGCCVYVCWGRGMKEGLVCEEREKDDEDDSGMVSVCVWRMWESLFLRQMSAPPPLPTLIFLDEDLDRGRSHKPACFEPEGSVCRVWSLPPNPLSYGIQVTGVGTGFPSPPTTSFFSS